jgi:hypothetical protein
MKNPELKNLHLTLKKKWFDMIASGIKKEEYREIKPYWNRRLGRHGTDFVYGVVIFKNGYSRTAPTMAFVINRITTGLPRIVWTDQPLKECYIIELGYQINLNYGNSREEKEKRTDPGTA